MIKDFLEAAQYNIVAHYPADWPAYPGAQALEVQGPGGRATIYFTGGVTHEMTLWPRDLESGTRDYRWINPQWLEASKLATTQRRQEFTSSRLDRHYVDLDLEVDFFEKLEGVLQEKPFDTRVIMPLDLDEEVINVLMRRAHERDITFNQLISEIMLEACQRAGVDDFAEA